jgi:predicted DNA-binding transcriptional regulator YafY
MRNTSFRILWDRFGMLETSARLLRLLALLQMRGDWNGPQLGRELGVTTRTIRKDVDRLRALGYPVDAAPGAAGGYRLGAGTSLPPLLLDDEEAVAVAVGLRAAGSGGGIAGIQESSLRALAKLEQVLPAHLHRRLTALYDSTIALAPSGAAVEASILATIAAAIRDRQRLRFEYHSHSGRDSRRSAEPHRLIHTRGRWYLVAWDLDRVGWRTFRADRMKPSAHTGPQFAPRAEPDGDLAGYVERSLGQATWQHRARVKIHASADHVIARVPPAVIVEAIDEHTCYANVGSDNAHELALWLGLIDADFEAGDDTELAHQLRQLAARYTRAACQGNWRSCSAS